MDYEDIYNRFEAVGQNVNVRNGRARARGALKTPSKTQFFLICIKVDIIWKSFWRAKNQKKILLTAPHSKRAIPFLAAVRNGRARARRALGAATL